MAEQSPDATSSDYDAMAHYWDMVNSILAGTEAMRAPTALGHSVAGPALPAASLSQINRNHALTGESPYLPRFPNETADDYDRRRRLSYLTNIYADISRNLAARPFSKTLELDETAPTEFQDLADNIDGQGHNLHVFASETFKAGIDKGVDWILVDYTRSPPNATLAQERASGARPYWVHVPAERMLAVYCEFFAGEEIITHARISEPAVLQSGYGERNLNRVRVLNRERLLDEFGNTAGFGGATWELWEKVESDKGTAWVLIDGGPITIGIIPLVPFHIGRRKSSGYCVEPPLRDLAYMQVKLFQQESNLDAIKEMTAFPMLVGEGVKSTDDSGREITVPVGPRAVLMTPPGGDGQFGTFKFIEPAATSLAFLQSDIEKLRTEMRDLGMQPLTAANLTVITTANISVKAHSALQAWTIALKDALETAWRYTAMWMNRTDEVEVNVYNDFAVDLQDDAELDSLLKAEAQGVISKRTVQDEFKRRGVLSDDFNPDDEEQRLAEQQQGLEADQQIDPVTGLPLRQMPAPIPVAQPAKINGGAVYQ